MAAHEILAIRSLSLYTLNRQVSDDGEACVWNMESGALRRRCVPEAHDSRSPNEQPLGGRAYGIS